MPRAVILGGTGQIGFAAARRLVTEGWDVTIASRHVTPLPDGCRHETVDSRDAGSLAAAVGPAADLLLSCVAFDSTDAQHLAEAGRKAGRIVAISSASVYRDAAGRTLDEAAECGFPNYPVPLTEQSMTLDPGPETYSTRKAAMEKTLLDRAPCPVTILRPCAIHGPRSKHAREWWFVKRVLDGRRTIPLAYHGRSRFQTTSADAIADAVVRAVAEELPMIANVSDADSPTVAEIGRTVMTIMETEAELVGLPDEPFPPKFGATPWSLPRPMVCSAAATGRQTYAGSVTPAVKWLVDTIPSDGWPRFLPQLAAYPNDHFDYDIDDRALSVPGAAPLAA